MLSRIIFIHFVHEDFFLFFCFLQFGLMHFYEYYYIRIALIVILPLWICMNIKHTNTHTHHIEVAFLIFIIVSFLFLKIYEQRYAICVYYYYQMFHSFSFHFDIIACSLLACCIIAVGFSLSVLTILNISVSMFDWKKEQNESVQEWIAMFKSTVDSRQKLLNKYACACLTWDLRQWWCFSIFTGNFFRCQIIFNFHAL